MSYKALKSRAPSGKYFAFFPIMESHEPPTFGHPVIQFGESVWDGEERCWLCQKGACVQVLLAGRVIHGQFPS